MTAKLRHDDSDGDTPRRTVRVPDDEWRAAKAAADANGDVLSEVVRLALKRYVARTRRQRGRS